MYLMWNETLKGGTIDNVNFVEKPDIGIDYVWLHFTDNECEYRQKDSDIQYCSEELVKKCKEQYKIYSKKYLKKTTKQDRAKRF